MAERSVSDVRTHPLPGGYGWYYFDAISLDGRYVLVATWHSGFLFSPRYYDEVLELRDAGWKQPDEGPDLADPTNYGAFGLALYDRGRTEAYVIVEASLVRGGSDLWFPNLHAGAPGLGEELPAPGATLGVGENRVTRDRDGSFQIEFSDRSKYLRRAVEGSLKVRSLTPGSGIIPLATEGSKGMEVPHEWQIVAARTEVTGKIQWSDPLGRTRSLQLQALGYVDRNVGRLPVSQHIGRWIWGRFQGSERTIAYFRLDPADAPLDPNEALPTAPQTAREFLYRSDRSGGQLIEGSHIEPGHVRRNRWGMPHPLEVRGEGGGESWTANVVRDIDRGPFNVRSLSRLSCADPAMDGVVGITECFLPARWDVPLYRLVARGRIRRGP